jgi:hypothetical protein
VVENRTGGLLKVLAPSKARPCLSAPRFKDGATFYRSSE